MTHNQIRWFRIIFEKKQEWRKRSKRKLYEIERELEKRWLE